MPIKLQYFTSDELACKCKCGELTIDHGFISKIEKLRKVLGFPFIVNSFYRCEKHNASLPNSSPNSYHMAGRAMDISVNGEKAYEIVELAYDHGFRGIGVYPDFIHLDDRELEDNQRVVFWVGS